MICLLWFVLFGGCLCIGGTCIRICNDLFTAETLKKGKNYPPVSPWVAFNAILCILICF